MYRWARANSPHKAKITVIRNNIVMLSVLFAFLSASINPEAVKIGDFRNVYSMELLDDKLFGHKDCKMAMSGSKV